MLLPVEIEHPYQRTPYATHGLLVVCGALYLLGFAVARETLAPFMLHPWGFAPHQLVTSALLHGGWWHLLGNMYFLYIYGRYVEERLGPWRFLAVFFGTSAVGGLAYLASDAERPCLGSSGGVSGLFGLVLVVAPWAQARTYLWLFPRVSDEIHIAVFWLLGFWVLEQVLMLPRAEALGVAISAHLGGFAAGAALGAWCRSEACRATAWYVDPAPPGGGVAARKRLRAARSAPGQPAGPGPRSAGEPGVEVRLPALPGSVSRVAVCKLLMVHAGLEPDDAMELVVAAAAGAPAAIRVPTREAADALATKLRDLCATAQSTPPPA